MCQPILEIVREYYIDFAKNMGDLNQQQTNAVHTTEGQIRVTAGAGTGKTRVLTYRYAYLVSELGIDPANILCLTFTNKAAYEMKRRLTNLIGRSIHESFIGTIHSFCLTFLRKEFQSADLSKDFIVQDREDCISVAKQILRDYKAKNYKSFLKEVSRHKELHADNIMNLVAQCKKDCAEHKFPSNISRYIAYQRENNSLDYDDLILYTRSVLANNEAICKKWQSRFNYIQVDECQDCNENDWFIIKVLSGIYHNLFVVGDPDQSIYAWRGAKPQLFVDFKADFDFVLEENYRSYQSILEVGNRIIKHNKLRIPKDLFSKKGEGRKVKWFPCLDTDMEGEVIANSIKNRQDGLLYSDHAVLYRSSSVSRSIEQALIKNNIPYVIWGGVRFYERKEIKDLLCYLQLTEHEDDLSFRRVVNVPSRGIGPATMQRLEKVAERRKLSLLESIPYCQINDNRGAALYDFYQLILDLREYKRNSSISELVEHIVRLLGLYKYYAEDIDRIDNIHEFIDSVKQYELENDNTEGPSSLAPYLQGIALYTNLDRKDDKDAVKLMTIHQSKGLEFRNVYICGIGDGVFPSFWAIEDNYDRGIEEERRLMYVASTRAQENLVLTGKQDSSLIREIGKETLDIIPIAPSQTGRKAVNSYIPNAYTYTKKHQSPPCSLEKGDFVEHVSLGPGMVLGDGHTCYYYKIEFGTGVEEVNAYLCRKIEISEYLKNHKLRLSIGDFVSYKSCCGEVVDVTFNKVTLKMLDDPCCTQFTLYLKDKDINLIISPSIGCFYYNQIEDEIAFTLHEIIKEDCNYLLKGIGANGQPVTFSLKESCHYKFKKVDKDKYLHAQEKKRQTLRLIDETVERLSKTETFPCIDYAAVDKERSYCCNDIVLVEGKCLIVKSISKTLLICTTLAQKQERRIQNTSNIRILLRPHTDLFLTNGKKIWYIKEIEFTKRGVMFKQLPNDMQTSSNISVNQLSKGVWRECTERDYFEKLKGIRAKSKYIEFKYHSK